MNNTVERLQTQVEQLIASNRDLSELLLASERRRGEMMKLIVAFRRLVEATDAMSAIRAVEEILVTVIGTEDFVVLAAEGDQLKPVAGFGSALQQARTTPLLVEHVTDSVPNRGAPAVVSRWLGVTDAVACIPLKIHDRIVGAVVIGSLLSHREPLGVHDNNVLCLLGDFAATSIIASEQRRSWDRMLIPAVA